MPQMIAPLDSPGCDSQLLLLSMDGGFLFGVEPLPLPLPILTLLDLSVHPSVDPFLSKTNFARRIFCPSESKILQRFVVRWPVALPNVVDLRLEPEGKMTSNFPCASLALVFLRREGFRAFPSSKICQRFVGTKSLDNQKHQI